MKKIALTMSLVFGACSAVIADDTNKELAAGLIKMAANMNEIASACQHMSVAELDTAKAKQKEAALADMKIPAAQYDQLYAAAEADFKNKWSAMSTQNQQQTCDQMKTAIHKAQ